MIYDRPKEDLPRMVFTEDDQIRLDESQYVPEMAIGEVVKLLPKSRVFTWPDEPDTRAGDIFVFRWAKVRHADGNIVEFPDVYIQFTANPQRHTSAKYWYASFILHGIDKTEFMAFKAGTTTNPIQALDKDAPHLKVEKTPEQADQEATLRYMRQRRLGKRERLRKAA